MVSESSSQARILAQEQRLCHPCAATGFSRRSSYWLTVLWLLSANAFSPWNKICKYRFKDRSLKKKSISVSVRCSTFFHRSAFLQATALTPNIWLLSSTSALQVGSRFQVFTRNWNTCKHISEHLILHTVNSPVTCFWVDCNLFPATFCYCEAVTCWQERGFFDLQQNVLHIFFF